MQDERTMNFVGFARFIVSLPDDGEHVNIAKSEARSDYYSKYLVAGDISPEEHKRDHAAAFKGYLPPFNKVNEDGAWQYIGFVVKCALKLYPTTLD